MASELVHINSKMTPDFTNADICSILKYCQFNQTLAQSLTTAADPQDYTHTLLFAL